MAIHVKDSVSLKIGKGTDFVLYANTSAELNSAVLYTEDFGDIICQPGSKAYTLAGELFFLSDAGAWTEVV